MSGNVAAFPIIFGHDLAEYALARLIHETTGQKPLLISNIHRGYINDSSIFDLRLVPVKTFTRPALFADLLRDLAKEFPTERVIPFINTDELVKVAVGMADELPDSWFLPYASPEAVALADSKTAFAGILEELDLATPRAIQLQLSEPSTWEEQLKTLTFPVVFKPDERSELVLHVSSGLRKVLPRDSINEAVESLRAWHEAGIDTSITVQELIPGDDTTQWVINGYINRAGEVTAIGTGRVLLGMHEPSILGNAGIILVEEHPTLISDAERILGRIGLHGFFSFDVKIDPRTGMAFWLDLNPRAGRNHYYLRGGGVNLYQAVLDDVVGRSRPQQRLSREVVYHQLPLAMLTKRYIRDPELLSRVRKLILARKTVHPMVYRADIHPKRTLYRLANAAKAVKAMRTHYPRATETGF